MSEQPKALRLAALLEIDHRNKAAAELRRQHERIAELEADVARQRESIAASWARQRELEAAHETAYSAGMVEGERVCMGKIAELEAALDVALEALNSCGEDEDHDGNRHESFDASLVEDAIAKLREVRRD